MRIASATFDSAINGLPLREYPRESWRDDPGAILMEQVRGGSHAAFDALFRKYRSSVVSFAWRFVRSRELAEEIAQLVFLQLYRARERYEPRARFVTYLYRITTNTCLNELRRRQHSMIIESLDGSADRGETVCLRGAQYPAEWSADPGLRLEGEELASSVQRVLDQMPAGQRSAFLLGRMEGLPYGEVAEALNTSVSSIKSLVFRATRTLRAELRSPLP